MRKKIIKNLPLLLSIFLIISIYLNIKQATDIKAQSEWQLLSTAHNNINSLIPNYCKTKDEKFLTETVKALPPISNALVEISEGRKSFYYSYPTPDGNWGSSSIYLDDYCGVK